MSYTILGIGQYNYVPTATMNPFYNLKQNFEEALFSPTAEVVLLRKAKSNTLYYAGKTTSPPDLLFTLNESMELGGIKLPRVIPVGDGVHNVFGFVKLPGLYPPMYSEEEFGYFLDMGMDDFPALAKDGVTSVNIDQFTNVIFYDKRGDANLIGRDQIIIPRYTQKQTFLPSIITREIVKGNFRKVKVELSTHYTGLMQPSFL